MAQKHRFLLTKFYKHTLFILLVISISMFSLPTMAQNNFVPGYYLNLSDDTIACQINDQSTNNLANLLTVKTKESGAKLKYQPEDITGFGFINGKKYEAKHVLGQHLFVEVLVKGRVNLYYQHIDGDPEYMIEKQGQPLTIVMYEEGKKYNDKGDYVYFKSKKHLGILQLFMLDGSDKIKHRINTISTPSRKNLTKLIAGYNKEFTNPDEGSNFVTKHKNVNWTLEPIINFKKFNSMPTFIPGLGLMVNIAFEANKRWQFKVGVIHHSKKQTIRRQNYSYRLLVTDIPLQAVYTYPTKKIQPFLKIGVGALLFGTYENGEISILDEHLMPNYYLSSGVGLKFILSDRITLQTSADYAFANRSVVFKDVNYTELDSYQIQTGISYQF